MNKREFIKNACKIGACPCVVALVAPEAASAQDADDCEETRDMNRRLEWRLNLAKRQLGTLLTSIEPEVSPEKRSAILEQMGRNCAGSLGWAEKFKDDPEGFFDYMNERYGETISFNESRSKITVTTPERDCVCPIVDSSKIPSYYCNCSIGWQKQVYETILGKTVTVILKESALRGSKRCVFEISIPETSPA